MSLESIKSLIDELTTLHISRGVQPSELVDNVFEDVYVESVTRRTPTGLIFEIIFLETDEEDRSVKVSMRYTYDRERYLILIEQKVAGKRYIIQWDRAASVKQRIGTLETLLAASLPREKIAAMLTTLPDDFLEMFPRLSLVA